MKECLFGLVACGAQSPASYSEAHDAVCNAGYGDLDNGCCEIERVIRYIGAMDIDRAEEREEMMIEWGYEIWAYEMVMNCACVTRYA